ncbi:hypothetical protein ALP73_02400 [Pseudomonas coronafaciens pv. garcae]|uniref:Histidine phosphatase family protein n=2 Tax=Pseudomonas syringae group TaxID=136849 RepID=A0AB37QMQ4_9PSED|nr:MULTISPECIES: hypothetical protein [Pseudomonas syringae group]KGS12553.1 hypothetical protein OA77_21240 [Pseudomonas coronafaciens]RMM80080.1 hypothetical protein ALQ71_01543 [Pseudomonas coronafaciens pv. striafaciens]RMO00652.1 hypothetical protein ALQ50_02431 [Pseudomonas coronafaciens pv. coronafaciens]RMR97854.1 hypothetical protein ALP74_04253 [Pseudomonas coronafaciens pv. garcae]RMS08229.1 hypothetical protein ALP73_02400 [Pseudomonas coronafaciens pv. garcae]
MNIPKMPLTARLQRRIAWFFFPSVLVASALVLFAMGKGVHAEPKNGTQTLVFLRHAEKPAMGLGQLNCQGLNRAIELSEVLPREFGKADFIFAANPSRHVEEGEGDLSYSYVRPLMTVGPSAIKLGLPVNIDFGANDTSELASEFMQDKYHNSIIYTAWSHGYLPELINKVAEEASGKAVNLVDDWTGDDFDSLVVVTLKWVDGKATLDYKTHKQGLNNGTEACPTTT